MSGPLTALLSWVRSPAYVDLTARQLAMLEIICSQPGPQTVRALAQRLGVAKPVVSRAADRMSLGGLVARSRGTADRRNVFIEPTAAGRRLHATITGCA